MALLRARRVSFLQAQNLYLRLILIVMALIGALDASLRQIIALSALFLAFLLLDLSAYAKLLRGLRISLPFFAAYWVFGTLFRVPFPDLALFSLKLIYFIIVTVYALGNLTARQVLHDTTGIRKYKAGRKLVRYALATSLFIRAYASYFALHKPSAGTSIGALLDNLFAGGKQVFAQTEAIEARLDGILAEPGTPAPAIAANLAIVTLMALLALVHSL